MSYINTLLFGIYPYIALLVLFVGTWARYDHGQFTWKAHSSQMLRKKNMVMASVLFHVVAKPWACSARAFVLPRPALFQLDVCT